MISSFTSPTRLSPMIIVLIRTLACKLRQQMQVWADSISLRNVSQKKSAGMFPGKQIRKLSECSPKANKEAAGLPYHYIRLFCRIAVFLPKNTRFKLFIQVSTELFPVLPPSHRYPLFRSQAAGQDGSRRSLRSGQPVRSPEPWILPSRV